MNSQKIGSNLVNNKQIIPEDLFDAKLVQEAFSLDERIEDMFREVRSFINYALRYFNDVRSPRFDPVRHSIYYYTDDRRYLLSEIARINENLVSVEPLLTYLGQIKTKLNLIDLVIDANESDILEQFNLLKNEIENKRNFLTSTITEISKIESQLSELKETVNQKLPITNTDHKINKKDEKMYVFCFLFL